MSLKSTYSLLFSSILLVTACTEKTEVAAQQPAPQAILTLQELMKTAIDPSADGVWNAVSSSITEKGIEEIQPHNDEEWAAVRAHAIDLKNAAKQLAITDRPVAASGVKSDNPGVEENPEEIQKLIAQNTVIFVGFAQQLEARTDEAIKAIDAKDPNALLEVGGRLDETCEGCHKTFWYPNQFKK
jgi:hypothetical protein